MSSALITQGLLVSPQTMVLDGLYPSGEVTVITFQATLSLSGDFTTVLTLPADFTTARTYSGDFTTSKEIGGSV